LQQQDISSNKKVRGNKIIATRYQQQQDISSNKISAATRYQQQQEGEGQYQQQQEGEGQ